MENNKKKVGTDLTSGNILKTLLVFAVPIMLTNLIQQLYTSVDLIVVGHYVGSKGTVGVSTGGEFAELLMFFSTGFASAGQILVAQLAGGGKKEKISRACGTLITFMLLMSVAFTVIMIVFSRQILTWQNCPAQAFEQAQSYMIITALGFPFVFGYNAICGLLRGMGEAKRPLLFVTVAAVSNIFMDLLLVIVIPLESAGTAIATVAAQFAAFAASFIFMYRRREALGLEFKFSSFSMDKEDLLVYVKLGLPLALQGVMIHITQIYMNSLVNKYDMVASATNSIGNRQYRFVNIAISTLSQAAGAVVGQNVGAGKYDRVRQTVYACLKLNAVLCAFNIMLAVFFPKQIFGIFTNDQDVIEFGVTYMHVCIVTFILGAWMGQFGAVVTGVGNSMLNLVSGILDGVVLRIGISLFCGYYLNMGPVGFFLGNSLARLAPVVINTAYFYSGKWKKRELLVKG